MFILYMGSLFSKPDFSKITIIGDLIDEYNINSKELNGDNLINVFINKIMESTTNSNDTKLRSLYNLQSKFEDVYRKGMQYWKTSIAKKEAEIFYDKYESYKISIKEIIKKLENKNKNAKAARNATAANATRNVNAKAAANANANGSRNGRGNGSGSGNPQAVANGSVNVNGNAKAAANGSVNPQAAANGSGSVNVNGNPQAAANGSGSVNVSGNAQAAANAKAAANTTAIANATAIGNANATGITNSNPLAITSETKPQEGASVTANNKKLSNSDEKRYSEILKNLQYKLLTKVEINIKDIVKSNKEKKKSLFSVGSDPITRIIKLFLIIQKLRKKLDNNNNNSTRLDKLLIRLTKDYLVRQENKKNDNKITNVLKELKAEIISKNDNDCKIEYDKELNDLFKKYGYLIGDNIDLSMFQLSSPDELNNTTGGSRCKKSKKSRS